MILYKIIGSVLLLTSSLAAGISITAAMKKRIAQLEALISFISHINNVIDSFRTPVKEIFENYKNPVLEQCGFIDSLKMRGWESAIDTLILGSEREYIIEFGKSLGHGYTDEQIKLCEYTRKKLEITLAELKGKYQSNSKMYRAFCFLGSLSAILILI